MGIDSGIDLTWSVVRRGKVNTRISVSLGGRAYSVLVPSERIRQCGRKPLRAWEFSVLEDGSLMFGEPKKKREWVPLKAVRDMSSFDAEGEWGLIRRLVVRSAPAVFGYGPAARLDVDGMASDIFAHFWERGFFEGYNSDICSSYEGYMARGVRNFLIAYRRSKSWKANGMCLSLDDRIDENGEALLDKVVDPRSDAAVRESEWRGLVLDLREACVRADGEFHDGSPVYSEMLEGFLAGEPPRGRSREFRERLEGFRGCVAPVFEAHGMAVGV